MTKYILPRGDKQAFGREINWWLLSGQIPAGFGNFPNWKLLEARRVWTGELLHIPAFFELFHRSSLFFTVGVKAERCGLTIIAIPVLCDLPCAWICFSSKDERTDKNILMQKRKGRYLASTFNDLQNMYRNTQEAYIPLWSSVSIFQISE